VILVDIKGRTLGQVAMLCCSMALFASMTTTVIGDRFSITYPTFKIQCIKDWSIGLIDRFDSTYARLGETYAFSAHNVPGRQEGALLGKFMRAGALDSVAVNRAYEVTVNGQIYAQGVPHAMRLKVQPQYFVRDNVLDFGRYWGLGDTKLSYDSRYWGSIDETQLIGRLIRLF